MCLHASDAYPQGQLGGEENNTLTISELPAHTHAAMASSNKPNASTPSNNFWSSSSGFRPYGSSANSTMAANAVSSAGLSQPHSNLAPYLVLNFCIAISGEFPTIN
jgi:microcystin-dependent protein